MNELKLPFEPQLLAYSDSWVNNPIMSVLVPIPTVKLAELRTHRIMSQHEGEIINTSSGDEGLSMNANSSRAIPIQKQMEMVVECPYIPIWTSNQKGMQGKLITDTKIIKSLNESWGYSLDNNIEGIDYLIADADVHKQDAALLLNPFSWTTCVITGDKTAWDNFFELRCGEMTYPAIQVIAHKIKALWDKNTPKFLQLGEWHIVFQNNYSKLPEFQEFVSLEDSLCISMSKCAMISYDNHGKEESLESHKQRTLERLIPSGHWSTAEHQYKVPDMEELLYDCREGYEVNEYTEKLHYVKGKYISNVKGWIQLRKLIECKEIFN